MTPFEEIDPLVDYADLAADRITNVLRDVLCTTLYLSRYCGACV